MSSTIADTARLPIPFDPFSDVYLHAPYPAVAAVRSASAALYSEAIDMWLVARYADVDAISAIRLRTPQRSRKHR